MIRKVCMVVLVVTVFITTKSSYADIPTLSIYTIQYTDNPDGSSYYDQQVLNCKGGIVIHKYLGSRHKLLLYDPNNWDAWGGIGVKGDYDTNPTPFNDVQLGDWIYLDNVFVDESGKARGNTELIFKDISSYSTLSTGNSLPKPLVVEVNDIAVVYDQDLITCLVTDHRAEKYEAMYIKVRNVTVGDYNDAGSHRDNYSLEDNNDPNIYCWASDYMNINNPDDTTPHPIVQPGLNLCGVAGILEQYTKLSDWDYYQLLTISTGSFAKTDIDGDCDFDFCDFGVFAQHWRTNEQCTAPDWCGGTDLTQNGTVNIFDLKEFSERWLEGK